MNRDSAKGLRGEAILWLRDQWPAAVIIPELSVATMGGARLDVAAVTPTELIGVEIKGEGDSTARLALQGMQYGAVATRMFLLPAASLRSRCINARPPGWLMARTEGGKWWTPDGSQSPFHADYKALPTSPIRLLEMLWGPELRYMANAHDVKQEGGLSRLEALARQVPLGKLQPSVYRVLYRRRWESAKFGRTPVWRPDASAT